MVASHTWAHKDLTTLSEEDINSEMGRVEEALERIIGVKPAFTRPPYGNFNDLVRQVADSRGQKLVTWDFDSGDSTGSSAEQSIQAYQTLADQHPSTVLALNHETHGARSRHDRLEPSAHYPMIICRTNCTCRSSPRYSDPAVKRLQTRHSRRMSGHGTLPKRLSSPIGKFVRHHYFHELTRCLQGSWTCD